MADHIRYDLLTQQALRGVVRNVLIETAKKGLTGDHHFYISFDTKADGARLSQRLRAQYPDEMTVILQHQFWDLTVSDDAFEVGLSFGGVPEKLTVPFDTKADGARLSQRLRAQYPDEMTVILQHQFWDLTVSDDAFEVGLSFGGVPEKLTVPFDAINGFFDPSVQFGLQFEQVGEGQDNALPAASIESRPADAKKRSDIAKPEPRKQVTRTQGSVPAVTPANPEPPEPTKPTSGAEVVRLDRFRKK